MSESEKIRELGRRISTGSKLGPMDQVLCEGAAFDLDRLERELTDALVALKRERATLRDTFAAAALTGMLSRMQTTDVDVTVAYRFADLMMKTRPEGT